MRTLGVDQVALREEGAVFAVRRVEQALFRAKVELVAIDWRSGAVRRLPAALRSGKAGG